MESNNLTPLHFQKAVILTSGVIPVDVYVYGDGKKYPYLLKVFIKNEPFGVFTEFYDFKLKNGLDSLWEELETLLVVKMARTSNYAETEFTCTDVVRLGSTSTRPDLMKWLHPYNEVCIPYTVELYKEAVIRRFSLRYNGMLTRETVFLRSSQRSTIVDYSYARWNCKHSAMGHIPCRDLARRMFTFWDVFQDPGRGLYYEFADLFSPAISDLSNAAEYEHWNQ